MGDQVPAVHDLLNGLDRVLDTGLTEDLVTCAHGTLHEVGSMHERKALMTDLADGFIALPGGFGTFDELFEITTWAQLGLHSKPVGLLDVAGYFTPLLALITHASTEGFIPPRHIDIILRESTPSALLDRFESYKPLTGVDKWTDTPPEP